MGSLASSHCPLSDQSDTELAILAITATWPGANWNREGGVLELYYTDEQKSPVWLAPFGSQMKWGL